MTLPEILIALVVVAILVMVLPPGLERGSSRAARDDLAFLHDLARTTAIQRGTIAELHIDADAVRYWIQVDTTGGGVYDTVAIRALSREPVTMTSDRSVLCFDGRGLATSRGPCESPSATIVFSAASGRADTLRTSATGMILR